MTALKMQRNIIQEILKSTANSIESESEIKGKNEGRETYDAGAEGDRGGLAVLSPHAIVLPRVGISIGIEHRDNHKLKLVN